MRISEVLGLSWSDVDFEKKRINVWRQISYRVRRGYFFQTPKTESSKRYIVADEHLLSELIRWRARQVENEKEFGDSYVCIYREDDGHIISQSKGLPAPAAEKVSLICTYTDGRRVLKNRFSRVLQKEGLNAHSFRHTHTTQLVENGAPIKAVAGRLGHSNTQITQNLYTRNTEKLQETAAAIFTQILQTNA